MDVEATLTELRALVTGCLSTGYSDGCPTEWAQDALEALELLAGLDEHLSRGGYLPSGWTR
ncbi:MAG: hypothetical protein ACT4RN_06510 [Pseudonocardia sp.]